MAKPTRVESMDYSDHDATAKWSNQSERLRLQAERSQAATDLLTGMSTVNRAAGVLDVEDKTVKGTTAVDILGHLSRPIENLKPNLLTVAVNPQHPDHHRLQILLADMRYFVGHIERHIQPK